MTACSGSYSGGRASSGRESKFIRSTKAHLADRMRQMMPAEDADRLLDGLPETFDEWRLANEAFFETADTKAA